MGSVSGMPPSPNSALPQKIKYQRCTSMHFGENQLSPALIGLSPLSTGHPNGFQPKLVRSSTASYRCFNLPMDRSTGFGSNACNYLALFRLGFPAASPIGLTSLHTITRRLIMQKARRRSIKEAPTACKRTVSGSVSLPCSGCFPPFPHGTGPLSVFSEYLALREGPRGF